MTLINARNIIKTYTTGTSEDCTFYALKGVSLKIDEGEFVAIMGASGSGKSTFMNIIGCLDKPTSGEYYLDGKNIINTRLDKLSEVRNQKLGFVFQGFNLISRTSALENVELPMIYKGVPPKERKERAMEALKIVGLTGKEQNMPNQLSGGQQQRVAIARAIVNDAPVILADEPTGNLDTKTSYEVMDFFVNLNEKMGKTIVLVTHEDDIAQYCKRTVRFKDGNIINDSLNKNREAAILKGKQELGKMGVIK